MTPLPVQPVQALDVQPPEQRWLIEDLWAAEAVGIVGGEPKCCKSFLALDVASSEMWSGGRYLFEKSGEPPRNTDEMIATVEQLGPYIVIAPGIALAHARPSPAVLRAGLSWVTLATPVPFGHKENDPVTLVVGLAAPDNHSHVQALATLAGLLEDERRRASLLAARTAQEVLATISDYEIVSGPWPSQ